jgi:hypothetical protein
MTTANTTTSRQGAIKLNWDQTLTLESAVTIHTDIHHTDKSVSATQWRRHCKAILTTLNAALDDFQANMHEDDYDTRQAAIKLDWDQTLALHAAIVKHINIEPTDKRFTATQWRRHRHAILTAVNAALDDFEANDHTETN